MVDVKPIKVFIPVDAREIATNPYDVIPEEEIARLRENPKSFIHVILPEGEEEKYENARRALKYLVESGALKGQEESFYLYKQENDSWSQRGIIGGFSLKDYGAGRIKVHEKTREKPLQDRIKHIQFTGAQTGLVWLLLKSNQKLKDIFDNVENTEPLLDFEKYGWRNMLWRIPEEFNEDIIQIFKGIDLYVADGHHRIEAAYRNMKMMEEKFGEGPWSYVMAYVSNDDEVRVLPYNRVIRKLPMSFEEFLKMVKEKFDVLPNDSHPSKHEICMFRDKWYKLIPKEIPNDVVGSLDVSILQDQILGPILGINDPRKDPNIFFVGGEQDLEKFVKDGNDLVFSLHPTDVKEIEAVADAGEDMPPKSTWFDPKLLSGLVVFVFEENKLSS
ncbi:MAG: DUF1015 domain-containing protein [Candidatus Aenigmarchaeota archaeon]|nr:DUF1015 domain-containing protein [Candidatus Aenigmarchaeota archaeon]